MIIFKLTTLITFHVHFRKYKETDCLPFTASRCKFHSNTNTKNEFNQQVWYSELPFSPVVSWHTKDFFLWNEKDIMIHEAAILFILHAREANMPFIAKTTYCRFYFTSMKFHSSLFACKDAELRKVTLSQCFFIMINFHFDSPLTEQSDKY